MPSLFFQYSHYFFTKEEETADSPQTLRGPEGHRSLRLRLSVFGDGQLVRFGMKMSPNRGEKHIDIYAHIYEICRLYRTEY